MTDLSKNAAFGDIDDLLDATMDDLDGLPPLAVPPTGIYTLSVTIERKPLNDKDALVTAFKVIGITEVADETEASDVVVGQLFQNGTYTKTKEGKTNEFGIAAFKDSLVPFAQHFFPDSWKTLPVRDIIDKVNELNISARIVRTLRKGTDDQYNFRLKEVIVL